MRACERAELCEVRLCERDDSRNLCPVVVTKTALNAAVFVRAAIADRSERHELWLGWLRVLGTPSVAGRNGAICECNGWRSLL